MALLAAPAVTLIEIRVTCVVLTRLAIAFFCTSNNLVELIGEGLAIAMVEWRLAAGIDTAAAQRVHQVANR